MISIFVGKNNESVHWNCNLCSEGLCAHSRTVTYTVFLHSTLSYPLHLQYMHVDDWALLVSLTNLASISAPCQSINLITVRSLSRKIIVSYWSLPAELTLLPFFAVLPIGRLQCWSTGNTPNKPCTCTSSQHRIPVGSCMFFSKKHCNIQPWSQAAHH